MVNRRRKIGLFQSSSEQMLSLTHSLMYIQFTVVKHESKVTFAQTHFYNSNNGSRSHNKSKTWSSDKCRMLCLYICVFSCSFHPSLSPSLSLFLYGFFRHRLNNDYYYWIFFFSLFHFKCRVLCIRYLHVYKLWQNGIVNAKKGMEGKVNG